MKRVNYKKIDSDNNYHHRHVSLSAWIYMTLSRHPSLSSIVPGALPGYILYRHRAVEYSVYLVVLTFARLCVGVHRSTSFMSSNVKGPTGVHHSWVRMLKPSNQRRWIYSCMILHQTNLRWVNNFRHTHKMTIIQIDQCSSSSSCSYCIFGVSLLVSERNSG